MPAHPPPGTNPIVEEQLDSLQRASEERRAELREIAAQLPEAMSRRVLLRKIVGDIRHAPDKRDITGRFVRKLGRVIPTAARSITGLLTRSPR